MTTTTQTPVGLVIDAKFSFGRNIWRGVVDFVRHEGLNWHLLGLRYYGPGQHWIEELVADGRVEAVVAADTPGETIEALKKARIPTVLTSSGVRIEGFTRLSVDDLAVGEMAADHLVEQGYTHFGFVGESTLDHARVRGVGFEVELTRRGRSCERHEPLRASRENVKKPEFRPRQEAMRRWLADLPKPMAIFAADDDLSLQLSEMISLEGWRIPEDIALLGVDDDELLCESSRPTLSSIRTPAHTIGYEAARIVRRMLRGEPQSSQPSTIPPGGITVRGSTDLLLQPDADLTQALRFIRSHATSRINVSDVVDNVDICRSLLERRFRTLLGRSPHEEIQRVRIERTRQLLAETTLPLHRVASLAGFRDEKHLRKTFVQSCGQTPSQYRAPFLAAREHAEPDA